MSGATQQTQLPDAVEDAAEANSGEHQQVQKLTKSKKAKTHWRCEAATVL
jgi:hypothetical protein